MKQLRQNKVVKPFLERLVSEPALCGLDNAKIDTILKDSKQFELVNTSKNSIDNVKVKFVDFKKAIIQADGSSYDFSVLTTEDFIKKHFSGFESIVWQCFFNEKIKKDWKISILLLR